MEMGETLCKVLTLKKKQETAVQLTRSFYGNKSRTPYSPP